MLRKLITVWVLVGTMLAPALTRAAAPLQLKSVTVDLPDEDRMFTGPGADAINSNCLACHSAGMVLDQPALSRETWTAEVNKMITAYKAPVAPGDVPAIIDYLTRLPSGK
jgi:cytochrome c553